MSREAARLVFRDVYLTFQEYARLSLRYTLRTKLTLPLLPLGGVASWLVLLLGPRPVGEVLEAYSRTLLVTLFSGLIPFSLWRGIKRNYLSSKILRDPATYTFEAAGIRTDSACAQAVITWGNASTWYRLPPYALLMVSTVSGYFLDFRCLEAPGTEADFLVLVRRHGAKNK